MNVTDAYILKKLWRHQLILCILCAFAPLREIFFRLYQHLLRSYTDAI